MAPTHWGFSDLGLSHKMVTELGTLLRTEIFLSILQALKDLRPNLCLCLKKAFGTSKKNLNLNENNSIFMLYKFFQNFTIYTTVTWIFTVKEFN